jgi:hypothetical protein
VAVANAVTSKCIIAMRADALLTFLIHFNLGCTTAREMIGQIGRCL